MTAGRWITWTIAVTCLTASCFTTLADLPMPVLDGRLSEAVWDTALDTGAFVSTEGKAVIPRTDARILPNKFGLYIAFQCLEPQPSNLRTTHHVLNSNVWLDDSVELFLDTNQDRQTYFHLVVNTQGVYFAQHCAQPLPEAFEAEWQPPVDFASHIGEDRWTAELFIPFAGIPGEIASIWNLNLCRNRFAGGEPQYSCWSPTHGSFHSPEAFLPLENVAPDAGIRHADWGNFRVEAMADRVRITGTIPPDVIPSASVVVRFEDAAGRRIGRACLPAEMKGGLLFTGELPGNAAAVRIVCLTADGLPTAITDRLPIRRARPVSLALFQPFYDIERDLETRFRISEFIDVATLNPGRLSLLNGIGIVLWSTAVQPAASGLLTVPIADLAAGEYRLELCFPADQSKALSASVPFSKLPEPNHIRIVNVDEQGVLHIDSEPFFPVGLYRMEPRQWGYYLKGTGINTVHSLSAGAGRCRKQEDGTLAWTPLSEIEKTMDEAEKNGLKVLFELGVYVKEIFQVEPQEKDGARLREVVSRFRRHPALLAYYLIDEPYPQHYQRARRAREMITRIDPNHPVISSSLGYPNSYKPTADLADILLVSRYPVFPEDPNDGEVSRWLHMVREKVGSDKPIWFVPQAVGRLPKNTEIVPGRKYDYQFPTPQQEQSMVYQALLEGNARGLIYFAWFGDRPRQSGPIVTHAPVFWQALKDLGRQVQELQEVLFASDVVCPVSAPSETTLRMRKADGYTWVLMVNHSNRAGKLCITNIPDMSHWREVNAGTAAVANPNELIDPFGAYAVRIWRGPSAAAERLRVDVNFIQEDENNND